MATITNFEGKYSINVPKGKSLTFSYIGYKAEVKQVISGNALNVVLESDSKMLNEVVAIGYGTMKKVI